MATYQFYDRVQEKSTTTGTGTYTLSGAVAGFREFSIVGNLATIFYVAKDVDVNGIPIGGWEVGIGTYTVSGTTLARTSILASSNAGAAVSWGAGTRRIANVQPAMVAGRMVQLKFTQSQDMLSGTGTCAISDTIPTQSNNTEFLLRSFTPRQATNILRIDVKMMLGHQRAIWYVAALHRDSIANALATGYHYHGVATAAVQIAFTHFMVAGDTAPMTFKVRGGGDVNTGGIVVMNGTYNGSVAARYLGGVNTSSIVIREYIPNP